MSPKDLDMQIPPSQWPSPDRTGQLVDFAAHRKAAQSRFPAVDELLERLTESTVAVAGGTAGGRS